MIKINHEADDIDIKLLSISQIVPSNPIIADTVEQKKEYLKRLNSYVHSGQWDKRKFEKSELQAYEKIIMSSDVYDEKHDIDYYKYYLILDTIHILGYKIKFEERDKLILMQKKILSDFKYTINNKLIKQIIEAFEGHNRCQKIQALLRNNKLKNEFKYIDLMLKNTKFMDTKPIKIMVTATMSAGKSTFVNALIGKYICLSQNMVCTSKIHNIVNKTFEDGYSYKYDYDIKMIIEKEELLHNNKLNISDNIVVGTHFTGFLSDQRIIISDSPGVNSSENQEHKLITNNLIKQHNYDILIYVMNITQLGTNDDDAHLNYVKEMIGETPILFIINKIDCFHIHEENFSDIMEGQKKYLEKKGFQNPIICPISAKAGYLSKKFKKNNLSKIESRELYHYVDKFAQMKISEYYQKNFSKIKIKDVKVEEEQLQKTSGLAYVEKLMVLLTKGGK